MKLLKDRRPFVPVLNSGLGLVVKNLPGIAAEIEQKLVIEGIAKNPFRLEKLAERREASKTRGSFFASKC